MFLILFSFILIFFSTFIHMYVFLRNMFTMCWMNAFCFFFYIFNLILSLEASPLMLRCTIVTDKKGSEKSLGYCWTDVGFIQQKKIKSNHFHFQQKKFSYSIIQYIVFNTKKNIILLF